MQWSGNHLFDPPPISGVTINTVQMPPEFRDVVYVVIAVTVIAGTLFHLRKHALLAALKRAVVVSFFIAGFLYAVRADYGWGVWVSHDMERFGGLTTEQKLLTMEGPWYEFIIRAKKVLPDEYRIYSSDQYLSQRSEYFFLPKRKRQGASTVVVLSQNEAGYDPAKRTLVLGKEHFEKVEPVLLYHPSAFVVKVP